MYFDGTWVSLRYFLPNPQYQVLCLGDQVMRPTSKLKGFDFLRFNNLKYINTSYSYYIISSECSRIESILLDLFSRTHLSVSLDSKFNFYSCILSGEPTKLHHSAQCREISLSPSLTNPFPKAENLAVLPSKCPRKPFSKHPFSALYRNYGSRSLESGETDEVMPQPSKARRYLWRMFRLSEMENGDI